MFAKWRRRKTYSLEEDIYPERTRCSVPILSHVDCEKDSQTQRRRTTSAVMPAKRKSIGALNTIKSGQEHIQNLAKHYTRRPAITNDSDSEDSTNGNLGNFIAVSIDNDIETVPLDHESSLKDIILSAFQKRGQLLTNSDLNRYTIFAVRNGLPLEVNLDSSAMNYQASVVRLGLRAESPESSDFYSCGSPDSPPMFNTVELCLQFFEEHGLREIPCLNHYNNNFPLPRVHSVSSIESCWEELPIDPELKMNMTANELSQQQTLWELISTEHSHIRQLEVVINLFMRALELLRRADLLGDVNYHNVFGYMEDIYSAHEIFWGNVLQPMIDKARRNHCPLDVNDLIMSFPSQFACDFEIYEQHCPFEKMNLRSLDEAMGRQEFRTYLEWCEAQPECNRLKLKDFLAKPMQRITKYPLLFSRILKKTVPHQQVEELNEIVEVVTEFVNSVNGALQVQEETERVEEVMDKIVGYSAIEVPSEFKELVQPFTKLDLLAPMPDVEISKPRFLLLEGRLRLRENHTKTPCYAFLFTDMLILTKPTRRLYTVIRPPYRVNNLHITINEQGLLCCVVVDEYKIATAFFTLKATSVASAQVWAEQIEFAKEIYTSAIEQKAQSWQLLQRLRNERIIDGSQEFLEPLNSSKRSFSAHNVLQIIPTATTPSGGHSMDLLSTDQHPSAVDNKARIRCNSDVTSIVSPPMKWKRVGSLNTLAERHFNVSSLLVPAQHSQLPVRDSYELLSAVQKIRHTSTQTDPYDYIPLISESSRPIEAESIADDNESSFIPSPNPSLHDPPTPFDQVWSRSSTSFSVNIEGHSISSTNNEMHQAMPQNNSPWWDSDSPDDHDEWVHQDNSLMSEIMSELYKPKSGKTGRQSVPSFGWYVPTQPSFVRGGHLRRSKSYSELSSSHNRYHDNTYSPMTHFPNFNYTTSSPIKEEREEELSLLSSPIKQQGNFLKFRNKLSFKQPRDDHSPTFKKKSKGKVRVKSVTAPKGSNRWGFLTLIKNKWLSTESGLHNHKQDVGTTRKRSRRTMRVVKSQPETSQDLHVQLQIK